MRAVIQRVSRARVTVSGEVVGEIGTGLLVLLGVEDGDTQDDVVWMANKVVGLRVFEDSEGKMNLDVGEVGGAVLAVSQFTLLGDCRKGRRPSFVAAARPDEANALYRSFVAEVAGQGQGLEVAEGRFQEHMEVELVNDGPVTLQVDSRLTRHGR
ncbi:MAG: D-aminoacyl-tRNA deacylase [Planctomycetaceae bacterium]